MRSWLRHNRESTTVAIGSESDSDSSDESVSSREQQISSGSISSLQTSQFCKIRLPLNSISEDNITSFQPSLASTNYQASRLLQAVGPACNVRSSGHLSRAVSNPEFLRVAGPPKEIGNQSFREGSCTSNTLLKRGYMETMRLLVLGFPQVGKSALVNSYRAAVTNNMRWPAAPVGICGYCGTTTVDPFPDHPTGPTWLCIDTPGKFYNNSDRELLQRLFFGVPWHTRLAGHGALCSEDIENLPIVPENSAHQCIIVVPATDIVEDNGWSSVFWFKSRYDLAPDAEGVVRRLSTLICMVRSFLLDASPFVVVTKMDLVGGVGNMAARRIISYALSRCIPVNRLFFCASPDDQSSYEAKSAFILDRDSRRSLIQLHEELFLTFRWRTLIDNKA